MLKFKKNGDYKFQAKGHFEFNIAKLFTKKDNK